MVRFVNIVNARLKRIKQQKINGVGANNHDSFHRSFRGSSSREKRTRGAYSSTSKHENRIDDSDDEK
jgi:hypothetical protein